MADQFIGEIRMFAGTFAPQNWLFCDGTLVSIADYDVLFNLIGTTYGGDGVNTFALPDLRGRVPVHQGNNQGSTRVLGQSAGTEAVTLTPSQVPVHRHSLLGTSSSATATAPGGQLLASVSSGEVYINDTPGAVLNPASLSASGGSQPHENRMPFQAINFIISFVGLYPSPA